MAGLPLDRLAAAATIRPDALAFRYLTDGESAALEITYGDLFARAAGLALRLASEASAGDRALLLCTPGLESLVALFGCFMAGIVATPVAAPHPARIAAQAQRLVGIVRDCRPAVVLATPDLMSKRSDFAAAAWEFAAAPWIAVDGSEGRAATPPRPSRAEDLAILQYTSGSTSSPKGVMLTHANLAANQRLTADVTQADAAGMLVSWLPFHHDMGLGLLLHAVHAGCACTFMSPLHFTQRPMRWLECASRYGATATAAPNFALDRIAARLAAGREPDLDLSRLRTIVLGAEPLRARTLEAFARALAPAGFRAEALVPCYGLAESTVHCTHSPPGAGPIALAFDAAALRRSEVRPVALAEGPEAVVLVGNGDAGPLHEVRIVDPDSGKPAGPHRVGEIWFRGPSVGLGYWGQPEASAQTFAARVAPDGAAYLRTGDLGFVHAGHLFITGRHKDLIIIRGRNIHPEDVEDLIRRTAPEVGDGVAAVEAESGAGILVLAELRGRSPPDPAPLLARIREAVATHFEVEVLGVQLLPPLRLPRTTSGKVRRGSARESVLSGEIGSLAAWRSGAPVTVDA